MTMSENMHSDRRDDLAAYALGGLDQQAAAEVESHLAECEACSEYVRWLAPALDLLPVSVAQVEPPKSLRKSLMKTVRAEAAEEARSDAASRGVSRWRSWRGVVLRPATGLAALAVLAAGGIAGYVLSDSDSERAFVEARAAASLPEGAVSATLEHGAGGDAILHVDEIPALDPGHVYQTWVQREGVMRASASFRPHDDGSSEVALGESLSGAEAVAVTEEAARGETRPSERLVLTAPLN